MKTAPNVSHWTDRLAVTGACAEAVGWAAQYETPDAAWEACERGDWMLWILGRLAGLPESAAHRKVALVVSSCVDLSLSIYEAKYPADDRVRRCIQTCRAWANGTETIEELRKARTAALAAYTAATECADPAAAAAAYAAASAVAAAAAYDSAAAAYAASTAHYAAVAGDAKAATLKQCAEIVREHYPQPPELP